MAIFIGSRLFARGCNGLKEVPSGSAVCSRCWKLQCTLRRMAWRLKRRPAQNEEHRLLYTAKANLSKTDREKKEELMKRRRSGKDKKMRAELAKAKRALERAKKFVPRYPEDRNAVASIVSHLDAETDKIKNPICRWSTGEGDAICGHRAESCQQLLGHVNNVHISKQKNPALEPLDKEYFCCWRSCTRRRPFGTWKTIYEHLKDHTGTSETEQQVNILRNQMINANRSRPGRRHIAAAKELALAKYRGRKSWKLACEYAALPMISGKTIRAIKNAGYVTTGIDVATIERMARIAATRPYVRHGILIVDEVRTMMVQCFHTVYNLKIFIGLYPSVLLVPQWIEDHLRM